MAETTLKDEYIENINTAKRCVQEAKDIMRQKCDDLDMDFFIDKFIGILHELDSISDLYKWF